MNKIYKIDARFYFCLILGVKDTIESSGNDIIIEKINAYNSKLAKKNGIDKYIRNCISDERVSVLLKCVGAAIFYKNSTRYFALTEDVYQLMNTYSARKLFSDKNSNIPELLSSNLKKFNHYDKKEIFDYYLEEGSFINVDFPKELKNLKWFITHNAARKEKADAI